MAAKGKTNWNDFTKQELIRTIKRLDKRQTELLNEITFLKEKVEAFSAVSAGLQRAISRGNMQATDDPRLPHVTPLPANVYPWESK